MNDYDDYGDWPPCLAHEWTLGAAVKDLTRSATIESIETGVPFTKMRYKEFLATTSTGQAEEASIKAQVYDAFLKRLASADDAFSNINFGIDRATDALRGLTYAATSVNIPIKDAQPDLNEQLKDNPLFGSF